MVKRRLDEAVFSFIYAEAMDDATRRTDAASIKSDILAVKSIKKLVKEYSDKVIAGDNPDFYEYENKIEKVIKKKGDKLKDFTFGNIQKLINMTMKYLYI